MPFPCGKYSGISASFAGGRALSVFLKNISQLHNKPFPCRGQVPALRRQYDADTIIELTARGMNGAICRPGDIGTVRYADDAGRIRMRRRRCPRPALVPETASFGIVGHGEHE